LLRFWRCASDSLTKDESAFLNPCPSWISLGLMGLVSLTSQLRILHENTSPTNNRPVMPLGRAWSNLFDQSSSGKWQKRENLSYNDKKLCHTCESSGDGKHAKNLPHSE
jgi:hypothetical protein